MSELENELSSAVRDISAERQRQIKVEKWGPDHDDFHVTGELAKAAACYANPMAIVIDGHGIEIGEPNTGTVPVGWPDGWSVGWWKPSTRRRDLVKAGALIVAEIERIDRMDVVARCPICEVEFKPDDICATDITEGCCHAECLAGSPVVDLETGDEVGGTPSTYVYSEIHKGGE